MRQLNTILMGLALLMAAGCGREESPTGLDLYPVEGVVTMGGDPVAGATINFYCKEANKSAFGYTNEDGEYVLTTSSVNDGAVAGSHTVTITKFNVPPETPALAPVESEDYAPPGFGEETAPAFEMESLLPKKYSDPATSGLTAVVGPDSDNEFDFDLTAE